MAHAHYNPAEDIFPALQNDLNGDDEIDGIQLTNPSFLDKNAGVAYNANYALTTNTTSTLFYIQNLSGVSKGLNTFSVSTRGGKDAFDYFRLLIYFPELGSTQFFDIPTNSLGFVEQKVSFIVPEGVTYLNITLNYNTNKSTRAYASGFKLSAVAGPVIKSSIIKINTHQLATPIPLDSFASCVGYSASQLKWTVIKSSNLLNASIINGNDLWLQPSAQKFPVINDSIQLVVEAPNKKTDTAWFYIQTKHPVICEGQLTLLQFNKQSATEKSYSWAAQNADAVFVNTKDTFLWVRPQASNVYTLTTEPFSGVSTAHPINVNVLPTRIVGYPSETKQFLGAQTLSFNLNYNASYQVYLYDFPQAASSVTIKDRNVEVRRDAGFNGNLAVKLLVVSPTCEAYRHDLYVNTWPNAIKEFAGKNISIYPNPANQELFVSGLENFEAMLLDANGRLVKRFGLNQPLSISELEDGVYILKLEANEQEFYHKIIKAQ